MKNVGISRNSVCVSGNNNPPIENIKSLFASNSYGKRIDSPKIHPISSINPNMEINTMKKILLITLMLVLGISFMLAQAMSEYTYSTVTDGSLIDMSSGTTDVFATGTYRDDVASTVMDIGFSFTIGGTPYTQFSINSNGQMQLGSTVISGTNATPSVGKARIAPISGDNALTAVGKAHYKVLGSAPNRILVVEWDQLRMHYGSTSNPPYCTIQALLYETSNKIDFIYGLMYNTHTSAKTLGIFVATSNTAGTVGQLTTITGTPTWNTTATSVTTTSFPAGSYMTNLHSDANGSRRVFTFNPPVAGDAPNPATLVSPANAGTDIALNASLNWSSGGGLPEGYKLYFGTSASPAYIGDLGNVTTYSPAGMAYSTTYYWQVVPYNANGDAAACPVWSFTTMPDPAIVSFPHLQNFDGVTAPTLPGGWTAIDVIADNVKWATYATTPYSGINSASINYHSSNALNDWLVSPPISLQAGTTYSLEFYYRGGSTSYVEKLKVMLGTGALPADLTTQLFVNENINFVTYTRAYTTFTVPTTGTYYMGWYAYSIANQLRMYVDDIIIRGATHQLLFPNGGENWQSGSTKTVYWKIDTCNSVNISLSINNGQSWIMLSSYPVETALGRFSFTVPFINSSQCLIKVEDAEDSNRFDISDAPFTISNNPPASLSLVSPTQNRLQAGRNYSISWIANGVANVNLDYSCDTGLSWNSIATNLTSAPGSYTWTVPDTSAAICYIRVSSSTQPNIYDLSDAPFTIAKLYLQSPNGGELYQAGSSRNITWQAEQIANVKLEYSNDTGINWQMITASTPAIPASYSWTVPQSTSNQYLVRISDVAENAINDSSAEPFTVCALAVTYPTASGTKLQVGRQYAITWDQTLLPGNISIELSTDGTNFSSFATNIAATDGSYLWTVPDATSTTCKIKIVSEVDNQINDISTNAFTIGKLTLTSPNGNVIWGAQTSKAITWTSVNVSNVKLEYSADGGSSWILISSSVAAASGSYTWTTPNIHSATCLVRISDAAASTIWDDSDEVFAIQPFIVVNTPNGNEVLTVYSIYSILWTATAEVSFVALDYSINGGSTWLPIQTSAYPASIGRYDWIVPNNSSANCLVRVRNHANSAVYDVSDAVFTITVIPLPPQAAFSSDVQSGLQPLQVQFTDASVANTGNITDWAWDFGNGDGSSLQNPQYTYPLPGQYSVSLKVTNAAGLSDSLYMANFITVLAREPQIHIYQDSALVFPNTYLGSVSQPISLWISNFGSALLDISSLAWGLSASPFTVVGATLPITVAMGDSVAIAVQFAPLMGGANSDSLYIGSNDPNTPIMAIGFRGTGEYVPPKPPEGVQVTMLGNDLQLSWEAVTHTILETPIVPDYYLVFYNGSADPEGVYYYHGATPTLSYMHYLVGLHAQHMFYRVVAYKHNGQRMIDISSLSRDLRHEEVMEILHKAE